MKSAATACSVSKRLRSHENAAKSGAVDVMYFAAGREHKFQIAARFYEYMEQIFGRGFINQGKTYHLEFLGRNRLPPAVLHRNTL
ncbi:hypothetical protein [Paraburkholderia atlantica]|uniref:hypothetical protein n=1 Tax=Paraburkholderia atlantica TaxID=2654982 RepID=UPI001591E4CB|nr:hypothetical protein [Paraburkholderia atlantica]